MSTQASAWSQLTSVLLFALDTAVNVTADVVSELTRFVPNTFHRHMSDSLLPESAQKVMPFVRYIKSNASAHVRDAMCAELQEFWNAPDEYFRFDQQHRLRRSETIKDIRSSIKGTEATDEAVRSSLAVIESWAYGEDIPSERATALQDIAEADRSWTRPVLGVVGAVVAATAYSTVSQ